MQYIPVYAKRKHGSESVAFVDERLRAITEHTYGICLTGDTLVFDAASGRRVRLDELSNYKDVLVQGVDDDFNATHARITAWMDNGVRPVYRIKLRNGTRITATANHEFLTEDGWRRLDQLAVGDHLAVPRKLNLACEGRHLDKDERARMRVLAYLLADGSLCTGTPSFFSSSKRLLEDFERSCHLGFDGLAIRRYTKERGVVQLSVSKDASAGSPYHDPSELEGWLRERGLRWKRQYLPETNRRKGPTSSEKWIPEEVFELADEEIGRFLAALWDCDGYVGARSAFLKTISNRLALDVQTLLLRLGIRSSIYESTYEAVEDGKRIIRHAYQVEPFGTKRFAELVQVHMLTRKASVRTYVGERLLLRREPVLSEVLALTANLAPIECQRTRDGRLSISGIAAQTGFAAQHFSPQKRGQRIDWSSVQGGLGQLDLPSATQASRVAWTEIVTIELCGNERVYDVTVDRIHNFVANNVIAHNCIYQEQAMEIAKEIAGFSPAEADDLRKAISKKIHALMASLKAKFLDGCAANGVAPGVAKQLWDDMEKAQDYSFNKSHAACYALIAYRTAWLRANHPHEYMAALISSVMNTKDRVPLYVNACHEMGIEVEPPDVNCSQTDFAVVEGKIRFGLNAVKNVGEGAARAIIAAREEGGPFESIWDFTERVDPAVANKRALESLVKCGALDSTGASRTAMLTALEDALGWGQRHLADRLSGQGSIFEVLGGDPGEEAPRHHPVLPTIADDKAERLRWEKETLGLYVSEHPLEGIRDQLRRKTDCGLAEVERRRDGEVVTVGGIVGAIKQLTTKKGDPMVFMRLDDVTGGAEVVVFNSVYAAARELIETDRVLVVKGRVDHKQEGETKLLAIEVSAFDAIPERREVRLKVDAQRAPAGVIRELASLIRDFPGEAPVFVDLETSLGPKRLELGAGYRVAPSPDFYAEVKQLLGEAALV
jgi:DNA polymerase-3 subunit alpha